MHKWECPLCHKCKAEQGDFLHMVWACGKIMPFCSEVTEFIASTFELPNVCNPKWCLLGVFEDVDLSARTKITSYKLELTPATEYQRGAFNINPSLVSLPMQACICTSYSLIRMDTWIYMKDRLHIA